MEDIQQYLINDIQPLNFNDSMQVAEDLASEFKFSHLPVVENQVFLGCLIVEDIENIAKDAIVSDFEYTLDKFFVLNTTPWFDVLQVFAKNQSNIVPVLDEQNKYIGFYQLNDCINLLSDSPFFTEEGTTIVIEKQISMCSFSEITQIIESNNGKILGLFISAFNDNMLQITIKLNTNSINSLLQNFRRYEYNIISNQPDDNYMNALKDNSDYLDKYLNL